MASTGGAPSASIQRLHRTHAPRAAAKGADLLRESRLTDTRLAADPDEGAMAALRALKPTEQQR